MALLTDEKLDFLYRHFEQFFVLNEDEKQFIREHFKLRKLKRKQYLLQEGDICRHNFFIYKGALRLYFMNDSFKEYNLRFGFEGWWITDIDSFTQESPSRLSIQALENTFVMQLSSEDQKEMLDRFPRINTLFRQAMEKAIIRANKRILDNISSDAQTRYKDFLSYYDRFVNRIPDQHIASYIGVTPEFFSKLKKQLLRAYLKLD